MSGRTDLGAALLVIFGMVIGGAMMFLALYR